MVPKKTQFLFNLDEAGTHVYYVYRKDFCEHVRFTVYLKIRTFITNLENF